MFRLVAAARGPAPWHRVVALVAIGLLWTVIGLTLWHDRTADAAGALKDTANLTRTFEENIARTIEAVEQTLLFIREDYQKDHAVLGQQAWADVHSFLKDLPVQVWINDRDGQLLWTNFGPIDPSVNVADREHFRFQKASKDDVLFISRPLIGRQSNKLSIQFVRKLVAPDGSFDGIAVVSLDPLYLSRFYESIAIGKGTILLAKTDGTLLARAPASVSLAGGMLPAGTRDRMLNGASSGSYRTISDVDQVERIVSFRRLERYPVVVATGLATSDIFAAYERTKALYCAGGLLLSAWTIFAALVIERQRRSLLESRHALAVTLENMSQGIAMFHSDGSVPVFNLRAVELLGLPPELMAGRPMIRDIVHWQIENDEFGEAAPRDPVLAGLFRDGNLGGHNHIYEHTRPNGTILEVRSQSLPDGGTVCTYTDITDRRANEAALAEARSRAAHAERMQALGQLAGGIAHDFNNILQAVQGAASLIGRRAGDAAATARFVRMILEAADRGASITRRLLSFARRDELRAECVDLDALMHDLRDVLSHTLGSPVSVAVDIAADLPPVLADKGQLETALVNLATNARDAMPEGGTLRFTAAPVVVPVGDVHPADLRAGQYVRVAVSDTGVGMDAATLARVFEPFFTTKPIGQGTGLGLSMVRGFAEQSGGGMTIGSTPGRGTVVTLWLPAADRMESLPSGPGDAPGLTRADRQGRILLVDDEVMVRDTLAAGLEDAGYAVTVAGTGTEALAVLQTHQDVDVLVSDLSMPGMDGLAVIQEAHRIRPGLPAILLTGYAGHNAQLPAGGMLDKSFTLVRKPIAAAQLSDRIEALLAVESV